MLKKMLSGFSEVLKMESEWVGEDGSYNRGVCHVLAMAVGVKRSFVSRWSRATNGSILKRSVTAVETGCD